MHAYAWHGGNGAFFASDYNLAIYDIKVVKGSISLADLRSQFDLYLIFLTYSTQEEWRLTKGLTVSVGK